MNRARAGREAYAAMLVVSAVWGFNLVVVKWSVSGADPVVFCAARFAVGGCAIWALARFGRESGAGASAPWRVILPLAALGPVAFQLLFIYGISLSTAGHASVITSASPAVAAVESYLAGRGGLGPRGWAGVLLSAAGVCALAAGGAAAPAHASFLAGDALLAAAALAWGSYTYLLGQAAPRYGAGGVMVKTVAVGGVALAAAAAPFLPGAYQAGVAPRAVAGLLYSGVLSVGLGYSVMSRAVARVGAAKTSVFSNLSTAVALLCSSQILGEGVGGFEAAAFAAVGLGVFLVTSSPVPGVRPAGRTIERP